MEKIRTALCLFLIAFLSGGAFVSCHKEDAKIEPELNRIHNQIQLSPNGYLEFPDQATLERTLVELRDKQNDELQKWEAQTGILSMRNLFEQGLKESEELGKSVDKEGFELPSIIKNNPMCFKFLYGNKIVMNTYRTDIASVINKDGIVKVGGILFQYSYDYLKVITDSNIEKIKQLPYISKTDESQNIVVTKVIRASDSKGARTTFYEKQKHQVIEKQESTSGCVWESRLTAELDLAIVDEPIYESVQTTCIEWDPIHNREIRYDCVKSVFKYTKRRNYFVAHCWAEEEKGFCSWGGFGSDSRYKLSIIGQFTDKTTGVSKSVMKISDAPTSQLTVTIYDATYDIKTSTPLIDISNTLITFKTENDPKGRNVRLGFTD
ncbi:hypothetical protein QNI19_12575 [Cytophagaceae bacterium DM2B3-1]|uniref:DUF4848 domain-containing protein n=1 Tax=Xanthocytophaga flava TaxID=3048013 RepID=A0ABT7CJ68_9BACT|nr:hypothetical protein [Xanthocytophaga flavus]MDJ1467688.1 hypothetical protein [Xanthocytophaga flavus]MDJ1493768.1 hypothetical protein [Xanthocytophaga flavus]